MIAMAGMTLLARTTPRATASEEAPPEQSIETVQDQKLKEIRQLEARKKINQIELVAALKPSSVEYRKDDEGNITGREVDANINFYTQSFEDAVEHEGVSKDEMLERQKALYGRLQNLAETVFESEEKQQSFVDVSKDWVNGLFFSAGTWADKNLNEYVERASASENLEQTWDVFEEAGAKVPDSEEPFVYRNLVRCQAESLANGLVYGINEGLIQVEEAGE